MARPKSNINTKTKTISVLADDDKYMQENGIVYRHIVALGIQAHQQGWSHYKENNKINELQERVSKFSLLLESYARKFEKLCVVVEKGLDVNIKDDLSNLDELEEKIQKVYYDSEK